MSHLRIFEHPVLPAASRELLQQSKGLCSYVLHFPRVAEDTDSVASEPQGQSKRTCPAFAAFFPAGSLAEAHVIH